MGEPLEGYRRIREAYDQNMRLGMLAGASEVPTDNAFVEIFQCNVPSPEFSQGRPCTYLSSAWRGPAYTEDD
jgi:hypothetical protein